MLDTVPYLLILEVWNDLDTVHWESICNALYLSLAVHCHYVSIACTWNLYWVLVLWPMWSCSKPWCACTCRSRDISLALKFFLHCSPKSKIICDCFEAVCLFNSPSSNYCSYSKITIDKYNTTHKYAYCTSIYVHVHICASHSDHTIKTKLYKHQIF